MTQAPSDRWAHAAQAKRLRLIAEGQSPQRAARVTMPTKQQVHGHWVERLADMDRECHGDPACFACGNTKGLHRAHIQPVSSFSEIEFPNNLDNIHLLCEHCHQESEMLEGGDYWAWFSQTSAMSRLAIDAFVLCPELAVRAFLSYASTKPEQFAEVLGPRLLGHASSIGSDGPAIRALRSMLTEVG